MVKHGVFAGHLYPPSFLLSFSLIYTVHCQYILETKLTANQIESYCLLHCDSEFGSITTSAQFENIKSLLDYKSKDEILIGLKANPHPKYEWVDQSPFAFTEFNAWKNGQPTGEYECVAMTPPAFEWESVDCNVNPKRGLCNHCNGRLNKYVLMHSDVGYSQASASSACSTYHLSSTLASIHSERDYAEALSLCKLFDKSCWIGLHDYDNEGVFVYDDGTFFDFGTNELHKNSDTKDCVQISANSNSNVNRFAVGICAATGSNALCNLPSELCDDIAVWTKLSGNMDGDCIKHLSENSDIVMANRLFYNGPSRLMIEYTFSLSVLESSIGDSGIAIYNSIGATTCEYYYIFVRKVSANKYNLGFCHHHGAKIDVLSIFPIRGYDATKTHLLSVSISTENVFDISLDDTVFFSKIRHQSQTIKNGYSGYIGLKSSQFCTATAHSLYVSGTGWNVKTPITVIDTPSCPTLSPTKSPTTPFPTMITRAPSFMPSINPTLNPSTNPTMTPSANPTIAPSHVPSLSPTMSPSLGPSLLPTTEPSLLPSNSPMKSPTQTTMKPSIFPTSEPSLNPSQHPTVSPTQTIVESTVFATMNMTVFEKTKMARLVVSFESFFASHEIDEIVFVLERISNDLIQRDCGFTNNFHDVWSDENAQNESIINAIIVTCDTSAKSAFFTHFRNGQFEQMFVQSVESEIGLLLSFESGATVKYENKIDLLATTSAKDEEEEKEKEKDEEGGEGTRDDYGKYLWISWLLKIILFQLGLCCCLIVCYLSIKIKTKKLSNAKRAIEQQLVNERHKESNSNKLKNSFILSEATNELKKAKLYKFNNSGGLSTFAMPKPSDALTSSLSEAEFDDTTDDETADEDKEDETANKENGHDEVEDDDENYLKQLMQKINIKNDEKKTVSEMEIMSTYTDNENDGLFSFKSTFQNDVHMGTNKGALIHRMKTIETDTTFPSIPALAVDSCVKKSSCDTINTTNTMQPPVPESNPGSIAATEDGVSSKRKMSRRKYKMSESGSTSIGYDVHPSSYLTICEKCGTAHADNLGDCTPFIKFNKNQY